MSTKQDKIANFDPSQPGLIDEGLFGLPFTAEESDIVVMAVPWEVTVSFGDGASSGPAAVYEASFQIDLLHQDFPELWKLGIHFDRGEEHWEMESADLKEDAKAIIDALEKGEDPLEDDELAMILDEINYSCEQVNDEVCDRVLNWMSQGKKVILLGGDHSTPLGYYQALATQHDSFGILHFDAHMDLREAYEGFTYSHASIMYNAIQMPQVSRLVQVGIRDFSETELAVIRTTDKVRVHTDADLKNAQFEGITWREQVDRIIAELPQKVCVSFDIDALQQWYCPNTGTPVPGGLSYEQAVYMLNRLAESDKQIIGIDLVEVSNGDESNWDGNVGARLLFHLCGVLAKNNGMHVGERIRFS